ncbi:MAG: hypothetical protein EOP11_07240 [Proteobacteria bacterium]|nr:MAG: hypothetical protein EOP11_07240 [Pseudomonadota bacterium]
MRYLLATLSLLLSANALAATELTCDIKDRSMRFREDYYLQPDGSAWVVLSTQASDFEGKYTKVCASQTLQVARSEAAIQFTGPLRCGKHGQRDHFRIVDLAKMEIRGIYADSAKCRWIN